MTLLQPFEDELPALFVRAALLLLVGISVVQSGKAQSYLDVAERVEPQEVFHEMVTFRHASSADSATVHHVLVRIPHAALVFLKTQPPAAEGFVATPRVTVTLLNARGDALDTQTWSTTHHVASYDATLAWTDDVQGLLTFTGHPQAARYRLGLEAGGRRDLRWQASQPNARHNVLVLEGDTFAQDRSSAATPVNLGAMLPYGQPATIVLPHLAEPGTESAAVKLRRLPADMACPPPVPELIAALPPENTVRDTTVDLRSLRLTLTAADATAPTLSVGPDAEAHSTLVLDLDTERLADGTYLLTVETFGDDQEDGVSQAICLTTYWRDMPRALYDPAVAIKTLRFMVPETTVKEMLRGRRASRIDKLEAFWQERDPTPGTRFNELMAEYYRRIDEAAFRFRTGGVPGPDGLRTDQAAVFIRMGSPERVERVTPPSGGVQETWTYADGQRYTFWSPSSLDPFRLQR